MTWPRSGPGGADTHDIGYDVDDLQDAFDLELAPTALHLGLPLLAVCRGLQVVNVALGGTLHQGMGGPERGRVDRLDRGLTVTARAADGTVEGLELPDTRGWFTAVQWHPEDTAHEDAAQQGLFDALIRAARDGH